MSTQLRFNAAGQVFDAFPRVTAEIGLRPNGEEAPVDFARRLLSRGAGFDPIVYVASVLPRREAVWWGCQCVRALNGGRTDDALQAAEILGAQARGGRAEGGAENRHVGRHRRAFDLARAGRRSFRRQHCAGGRTACACLGGGDGDEPQGGGHPRDRSAPDARDSALDAAPASRPACASPTAATPK